MCFGDFEDSKILFSIELNYNVQLLPQCENNCLIVLSVFSRRHCSRKLSHFFLRVDNSQIYIDKILKSCPKLLSQLKPNLSEWDANFYKSRTIFSENGENNFLNRYTDIFLCSSFFIVGFVSWVSDLRGYWNSFCSS